VWGIAVLGVLAGWGGFSLSILALGEMESQEREVALSTAHAFGVLAALWVAAIQGAEDTATGFAVAAGCARPGVLGRLLGRALGAASVGIVVVYMILAGLAQATWALGSIQLLIATTWVVLSISAWGLLFAASGRAGVAVLCGLVLWVLGHLPWGSADLLPGSAGRALGAWLPGPRDPAKAVADAGATLPAAVAALSLAWAFAPRRESGE
jgi:hypothetical protein